MSSKTINVEERSDWNDLHCNYAPLCPSDHWKISIMWGDVRNNYKKKKRIRWARQILSRMRPSKLLLEFTCCSTDLICFSWNNNRQIRSWACASNFIVAAPPWLSFLDELLRFSFDGSFVNLWLFFTGSSMHIDSEEAAGGLIGCYWKITVILRSRSLIGCSRCQLKMWRGENIKHWLEKLWKSNKS